MSHWVAAFARRVHEYRRGGVLAHLGTRGLAGRFQSLLGIVHHEFFAESVDKTLGAAADHKLVGEGLGETHRVADLIAPQSARSADDQCIVAAGFDLPQRENGGMCRAHFFEGDEFVEHNRSRA